MEVVESIYMAPKPVAITRVSYSNVHLESSNVA